MPGVNCLLAVRLSYTPIGRIIGAAIAFLHQFRCLVRQDKGLCWNYIRTRVASMRNRFVMALIHSVVTAGLLGANASDGGTPVPMTPTSLDRVSQAFSHDSLPAMVGPAVLEAADIKGASTWEGFGSEPNFTQHVAWNQSRADRRLYISGMLGPSFANLSTAANDTTDNLLTAGGSIGIAFERARGRLRIETEAVGRDTYFGEIAGPTGLFAFSNWSVSENVWRDFVLTDRLGIYGGGGLGAGGYRFAVGNNQTGARIYGAPGTALAWQVGGGLTYDISERLTIDVGYRYFQINTIAARSSSGSIAHTDFGSNELMFSLRFFEPFRAWVR